MIYPLPSAIMLKKKRKGRGSDILSTLWGEAFFGNEDPPELWGARKRTIFYSAGRREARGKRQITSVYCYWSSYPRRDRCDSVPNFA